MARIEALAEPGGICVTALVREEVSARTSLAFEALGAQRLKNIPRPVRVFRVRLGDQGESGTPPPVVQHGAPRAWRRAVLLGLLAVVLVGTLGFGVRLALYRGPSVDRPRLSDSLVLPFSNLSGDPDQEYVSDALTEDLTTDLSRIEGAFVIARNTMQTYRGKAVDVKQLGRELGRPLPAGRQCAPCGAPGTRDGPAHRCGDGCAPLGGKRFDRGAEDLLTLQAEVTGQIARMFNLQLMEAESQRATRGRPDTLEAIDYARKAWAEIWTKPLTQETNAQALAYLEQARALDPTVPESRPISPLPINVRRSSGGAHRGRHRCDWPAKPRSGRSRSIPGARMPTRAGLNAAVPGRPRQAARGERDRGGAEPEPRTGGRSARHLPAVGWAPAGGAPTSIAPSG